MKTITFKESLNISKDHFESLEEFQLYIADNLQQTSLSTSHKEILDQRISSANEHPDEYLSIKELKSSIRRK